MCLEVKTIKTKRLILRAWSMKDLNDLYEFASVPGVGEAAGWEHHNSLYDSKVFLEMLIDFKTVYAIEMDNKVIGSFDFMWDENKSDFISIGYSLSKKFWGQGIMTEVLIATIKYFKENYDIKGFTARTFYNNYRSINLLERVGFNFIKQEYDECFYELIL